MLCHESMTLSGRMWRSFLHLKQIIETKTGNSGGYSVAKHVNLSCRVTFWFSVILVACENMSNVVTKTVQTNIHWTMFISGGFVRLVFRCVVFLHLINSLKVIPNTEFHHEIQCWDYSETTNRTLNRSVSFLKNCLITDGGSIFVIIY